MKRVHLKAKPTDRPYLCGRQYLCGREDRIAKAGIDYLVIGPDLDERLAGREICRSCLHIANSEGHLPPAGHAHGGKR